MQEQMQFIVCSRCGYRFNPQDTLRCPRCYKPVIRPGSCSGSCGKCISAGACERRKGKSA
ncbi:hypothetical protein [Desulfoscipio sp. XC116]|uniref:hypothetical protein n=1 Tax=Desulfoscipio sp. XC116 TaxID=3144975 RepID=UPI00325B3C03